MNVPVIIFSSIITSILGAGIGIAAAEIARTDYYTDTHAKYAIVGAVAGLVVGAAQECVRELKEQSDLEEAQNYRNHHIG